MKILIDGRLYGLENAGLGRYIKNLVENLAQIDKDNQYTILLRRKYFDTLTLPPNWKKVLADFRHYSFREQLILPYLISEQKPDLVHFPHFNAPVFYRKPYVVTIHDTLMHKQKGIDATTLPAPLYFLKRLAYHFVFKNSVMNSRSIIVPSLAVKTDLLSIYEVNGSKVSVTYEGVDESVKTQGGAAVQKPYFVYVGNAYPHKNISRLIEAMLMLNKNIEQKVILAIGSARNIFTQRLEGLIKKHKAGEYVKLLGFVKDEELGSLYKNSAGFVFPSLSEGFGLPGLEAMKAGTLLLTSDIPVFKEVYKNQAIYFDPRDPYSMAESMLHTLKMDETDRNKFIESGQEFVKRYSWAKMATETLDIYQNATKTGESSDSLR
jgi:glycosyltransferase involved in cell wall biosynthesis